MADTQPQPFRPITKQEAEIDELLASTANLVEAPFEVDDDWREVTREYDTRAFTESRPVQTADARTTVQMLKDARVGLDLFLNEASVALMVGHADLTDYQRSHLTKIVTFIEALGDRLDRVMTKK